MTLGAPPAQPEFPNKALDELRSRPQWVAYRHKYRKRGKPTKPPVNPHTGRDASNANPNEWGTYLQALRRMQADHLPGVGYVLTPDDDITGIDLDNVRDSFTGKIKPWARELLKLAETYAEVSPSYRGIRLFVRGKIPEAVVCHEARVEVYSRGRYLTVTGRHIAGTPNTINPAPRTLAVCRERAKLHGETRGALRRAAAPKGASNGGAQSPSGQEAPPTPPGGGSVNAAALRQENLEKWVPALFGDGARRSESGGYRISSETLGRAHEEDLSIIPKGIKDWGVHDMDDPREGRRTPIELVMEYSELDASAAMDWLCKCMALDLSEGFEAVNIIPFEQFLEELEARDPAAAARMRAPLREPEEDDETSGNDEVPPKRPRFRLERADQITLSNRRRQLVNGILPRTGLAVVWGGEKSLKTTWLADILLHVATGLEYRGRRTEQGAVVYVILEAAEGFRARVKVWQQVYCPGHKAPIPFYIVAATLDLIKDHAALVAAIREQLDGVAPVAVTIDTLARALRGSESSDEDMTAFVRAADYIRDAFDCLTPIVHHCGHAGGRPRGHSSLLGAYDALIRIERPHRDVIVAEVQEMKDGAEGAKITCGTTVETVGRDIDDKPITGIVAIASDGLPLDGQEKHLIDAAHEIQRKAGDAFGDAPISVKAWDAEALATWPPALGKKPAAKSLERVRSELKRKKRAKMADGKKAWIVL